MITATKAAARANNFVALHNVGPVDSGAQRKAALLRQYGFAQDRGRMMTFGRGRRICDHESNSTKLACFLENRA
jgi:hypothetical protein